MEKNNYFGGIFICIIFCIVLLFFTPKSMGEISIHKTGPLDNGSPDWIIDDIYIGISYNEPGPDYQTLFCQFRNIGDAPAPEITYISVVKHMRFGIIPISTINTQSFSCNFVPPLAPGKTYIDYLPTGGPSGNGMPLFGFIRYEVTVNPGNNHYNATFFEINPIFSPITWYSIP